jgi:hypothetical protein
MFLFDTVLLSGLGYLAYHIFKLDYTYWQACPMPFHVYLITQYCLIACVMRVPVTRLVSPNTQT